MEAFVVVVAVVKAVVAVDVVVVELVDVVVDAVAVAAVVEKAVATRDLRNPCGPYPRYKMSPTRYSILEGRGTRRTRTNAQFWTETRARRKKQTRTTNAKSKEEKYKTNGSVHPCIQRR